MSNGTTFIGTPWEAEIHEISEGIVGVVYDRGGQSVAGVNLRPADAHLIAAAPELYEALRRLDEYGHTDATWDLAKRAMAKARGES
jgi:hypothetical protein